MALYYFDVFNGADVIDELGIELNDDIAAIKHARRALGDIIGELIGEGRAIEPQWRLVVRGGDGRELHVLRFGDVFRGADEPRVRS